VEPIGAFTFVLHSHMPYARLAGRWPHGEEWVHEAICETYIPLLNALYDLKEQGVNYKITIGITPILAEQLADHDIKVHFATYIDEKIAAAQADIPRFQDEPERPTAPVNVTAELAAKQGLEEEASREEDVPTSEADPHMAYLAAWYLDWFQMIKQSFEERYRRDLIGAFRDLQDSGYIEITTCAATHGYLPLLGTDSAIHAQLKAGIASYERLFGRKPTGIWLPECAYRPAYYTDSGRLRPGIERFLAEQGIKVFFSETHTITGGQPVGVAAGDVIGPYGNIKRRYVIPATATLPERHSTTFQPYFVSDTTAGTQASQHSGVAVIGRNNRTGQQVWSADWGYPGDQDYREFHRKDHISGIQYWRVTGPKVELGGKDAYHPDWAEFKVQQHADHFARLVEQELRVYADGTDGTYGLIASNYDTELFGHWWFEGVDWIREVLRRLAENPLVELTTASTFVAAHKPQEVLHIPESSWGAGGNHFTWDNSETHWMWRPIHEAERRMEALAAAHPDPDDLTRGVLQQAARELLLLESSDWPFLVTTGQAKEYAIQRFSQHTERFNRLAESLEAGNPDGELAAQYWEMDRVFPDVDYRWWLTRDTSGTS
jgi:1,4-alpha-glucan branching enzyme